MLLLLLLWDTNHFGIAWNFALSLGLLPHVWSLAFCWFVVLLDINSFEYRVELCPSYGTVATCLLPRPLSVCCVAFSMVPSLFAASPFVGLLCCLLRFFRCLFRSRCRVCFAASSRDLLAVLSTCSKSNLVLRVLGSILLLSSTPRSLHPFKHYSKNVASKTPTSYDALEFFWFVFQKTYPWSAHIDLGLHSCPQDMKCGHRSDGRC